MRFLLTHQRGFLGVVKHQRFDSVSLVDTLGTVYVCKPTYGQMINDGRKYRQTAPDICKKVLVGRLTRAGQGIDRQIDRKTKTETNT